MTTHWVTFNSESSVMSSSSPSTERSYSSISGRKNAFGGQILSLAMIQEDGLTDVNIMDTINVSKFKVGKSFICFVNMFATIANKAF